MLFLYIAVGLALFLSFLADRKKTVRALKISWKKFRGMLPLFSLTILLASLALGLLSRDTILHLLGGEGQLWGLLVASLAGSLSAIPGFVAFPLAGFLLEKGVSYMILAAFTTTLMMVGVVSFPFERAYLGTRVALLRNVVGLVVALAVSLAVGLAFGEIFPL